MKCTFNTIESKVTKQNTIGAFVEGFIRMDIDAIPFGIIKWITNYEGVRITPYENGLVVKSWAETTCSEKDTYDETIGRRIAESKAKLYIYRFMRNLFWYMSEFHEIQAESYNDAYMKYDHCVVHEEEHIEKLGNANNE